ncbi:MAG: primary-amine oxidase [Hyphomicrobiaceae bacterium]
MTCGCTSEGSQTAVPGIHPLEPLTAAELSHAAAIVRRDLDLGPGQRFETIDLFEPEAAERDAAAAEDRALPRRAFVSTYDTASDRLVELIVSLDDERIESRTERGNARPRIGPDEFLEAERIVLADPRFVAALARRGITDLSLVCADGWSVGSGFPGGEERRLVQAIVWVRSFAEDNQFAHPLEGLSAVIDINRGEVLSVSDEGPAEAPPTPGNYHERFQTRWRTDMKPIEVVQPEGASFTVAGHAVTWCGWRFRIGFNAREGLTLHDIEIRDGDSYRMVMRRASIAEMIVPYGSPYGLHPRKNAFDCGEYGIGAMANSLKLGCDCLGAIRYFDAVYAGIDGRAVVIEQAICMHEEDTGVLWKHTDFRTGIADTRRNRRLVISFIATVGNYEYMFYWYLHLDGAISLEVKATGIVNTAGIEPPDAARYGTEVLPGVLAQIHQHIFCARLEMALDRSANLVTEVDTVLDPEGPENPHGNAFHIVETVLASEKAAQRSISAERLRYWRVVNPELKRRGGQLGGYRLTPTSAITALGHPRSQLGQRAGFTRHHVWATPTRADERWPAGDFVNQSGRDEGLPRWTGADRSLLGTSVTLWHVFGLHHMPRLEDFPVQPSVSCGFMMMPDGFFTQNPTLDVPPARSSHSCCA